MRLAQAGRPSTIPPGIPPLCGAGCFKGQGKTDFDIFTSYSCFADSAEMRRFSVSHAKRLAASWVNGLRSLPFPITGVLGMLDSELVSICVGHTQSVETFSGHPVLSCSYNTYQHMEKRWCSDRVVHHSLNTFIICKICTCRTSHYRSCILRVQVTQLRSFRR